MENIEITREEINKILLSSPMTLPESPSKAGLGSGQIKGLFYKFIPLFAEIINTHLNILLSKGEGELTVHNESDLSHTDIRKQIADLILKDVELGNKLNEQISVHNEGTESHPYIASKIQKDISSHNSDVNAHFILRAWLEQLEEKTNETYNLATGKAKIIPVKDAREMLSRLNDGLNIGDRFILSDENIPDFTLFEKDSTSTEAIPFSQLDLLTGMTFMPGKSYISNGYLLVASESGIDVSLFAKADEMNSVKASLEGKAEGYQIEEILEELLKKEYKLELLHNTENAVEVKNGAKHVLGLRTSLELTLPTDVCEDFYSIVTFRSGATPTEVISPQGLIFIHDDCLENELIPVKNRIYELHIRNVEGLLVANSCATDYEVIE